MPYAKLYSQSWLMFFTFEAKKQCIKKLAKNTKNVNLTLKWDLSNINQDTTIYSIKSLQGQSEIHWNNAMHWGRTGMNLTYY